MHANVNAAPVAGANMAPMPYYSAPMHGGQCRDTFVLIVVLFILLIIVGAVCFPK